MVITGTAVTKRERRTLSAPAASWGVFRGSPFPLLSAYFAAMATPEPAASLLGVPV